MINIRFSNRFLAFLTSGVFTFSLYGCSSSSKESKVILKRSPIIVEDTSNSFQSVTSSNSLVTDTSCVMTTSIQTTSLTTNIFNDLSTSTTTSVIPSEPVIPSESFSGSDLIVLDQFNSLSSDIINEDNKESFLDKGKKYFIYSVDFLFYDGEIKGVKFSDLTTSAKKQLLSDIVTIDNLICSKFPNYKETIGGGTSAAFNKIMELIKAGVSNINEFSREKLGEENYNKVGNFKDLFIETAFDDWDDFVGIVDGGKQKVKDWYENFRNNNQPTSEGQKQSFFCF